MGRAMVADLSVNIEAQIDSFKLAVDFVLPCGITVIAGASGSGKSTLLHCLAGLRKADKGTIKCADLLFFDAEKRVNVPPQDRKCGYVFQNLALFPNMNVAENICYGIDKQSKQMQQERLGKLLSLIKMEGMEKRSISALSGGQAQRVALARALAPSPKLLLLDEPFSALEAELREELGQELKALEASLNVPILLVTHSKSEALFLSKNLVLMENGKVKAIGPAAEILDQNPAGVKPSVQFSW